MASFEQRNGRREPKRPLTPGTKQSTGSSDEHASQPWRAPVGDAWLGFGHEPAQEVVGEQLDQEHGVIRIEASTGDFTETECVLQVTNDGLDFCASVVICSGGVCQSLVT